MTHRTSGVTRFPDDEDAILTDEDEAAHYERLRKNLPMLFRPCDDERPGYDRRLFGALEEARFEQATWADPPPGFVA